MKKQLTFLYFLFLFALNAHSQIGYQISLLNTATGEPRANETVNVTATITDSSGGVVWSGTQSVTSNDFGVLSLTVGNADSFNEMYLHKLPLFIEVSANGAMIGKSQILNVPVAEISKKLASDFNIDQLMRNGSLHIGYHNVTLYRNGTFAGQWYDEPWSGYYSIQGNTIYLTHDNGCNIVHWINGRFYGEGDY